MAPIVSTVEISRTPSEVFAYVTDPSRFGEWQSGVIRAEMEGNGAQGVGSKFTMTLRAGSSDRTMTHEITQIDPPRTWVAQGIDGPVRADMRITVEPLDGDSRSRVTISLDFRGHGAGKMIVPLYVRPQAAKEAPNSCQKLKQRLEQSA